MPEKGVRMCLVMQVHPEKDAPFYTPGLYEPVESLGCEQWLGIEPEMARLVAEMKELQAIALLRESRRLNRRPADELRKRILAGIQSRPQPRFPEPVAAALREANLPDPKPNQPVVFAGHDCIVRWVNPAFRMLCGYQVMELLGYKAGSKLRGDRSQREAADVLHAAVHERLAVVQRIINYHKNGAPYLVEINLHPVSTGFVAVETNLGKA